MIQLKDNVALLESNVRNKSQFHHFTKGKLSSPVKSLPLVKTGDNHILHIPVYWEAKKQHTASNWCREHCDLPPRYRAPRRKMASQQH